MSGNVDITFSSDEKDLVKGQAKLIKQQEELIEKYKKLAKEAKKGGKDAADAAKEAAKELERFAAATTKINMTPAEKYATELKKLDAALKAGKISQETYNRAVERSKAVLDQMKTSLQQTTTEVRKTGEVSKHSFGSSAAAGLFAYASGLTSLATAGIIAAKVLGEVSSSAEQLGQKQLETAPSLAMLGQVADTPEELERIQGAAKQTFAEGGAKTIPEAAQLQLALESANAGGLRADFSRLQASGLVPNATMMAEAAIKLMAGMGERETGDFRAIVTKAFGGAKLGLGSAEQLLEATAGVSSQAKRLDLTDEEVMAAVSTVSAVVGPEESRTQIEALLKGIEVEGIGGGYLEAGKTLREQIQEIKKLEGAGEDIREILGGRQEAVKGYGVLVSEQGQQAMAANLANIDIAQRDDWFGQKVEMAEATPANRAAMFARQKRNQAELQAEHIGIKENLANAVQAEQVEFYRQNYGGGRMGDIAAAGQNVAVGIHRWLVGNEGYLNSSLNYSTSDETRAAVSEQLEAARQLREAAARLNSTTADPNYTNAARARAAGVGGAVEAR